MKKADSVLAMLDEIPPEHLSRERKKRAIKLYRGLNELGRLDEESGEVYMDEKSLRKLLKEHTPPGFEERFVSFLRSAPDGHLLVADWSSRKPGKPIDWQTAVRRTVAGRSSQVETLERLGLSARSTNEEVKRALQQRMPDLSDDLFDPDISVQAQEIIDGLAGVSTSGLSQDEYWERFKGCMRDVGLMWLISIVVAFFFVLAVSGGNWVAALVCAGLLAITAAPFVVIGCLLDALR